MLEKTSLYLALEMVLSLHVNKDVSDWRVNNISVTVMRKDDKVIAQEELERS